MSPRTIVQHDSEDERPRRRTQLMDDSKADVYTALRQTQIHNVEGHVRIRTCVFRSHRTPGTLIIPKRRQQLEFTSSSIYVHPRTIMAMRTIGAGATITAGIQDIAAILPLLGTEQCEDHVSSALTKGYLYIAATPLSIFGSLGIARAGFKTLVASLAVAKWNFVGARKLANMGFKPKGTNLSLIMMDEDDHYLVENRVDTLLKELHIDSTQKVEVATKCLKWNITMMLCTAIACILSITPYIHLNIHRVNHLNHTARWIFPVLRAFGGFLTATMIQLVIQNRITTLARNRLVTRRGTGTTNASEVQSNENQSSPPDPGKDLAPLEHSNNSEPRPIIATVLRNLEQSSDLEKGSTTIDNVAPSVPVTGAKTVVNGEGFVADGNSPLTWCSLILLLIGIIASIIGYVGCFTVVQNVESSTAPLTWLCLEAGLSIIRIFIWSLNPTSDHAPPLELKLTLDEDGPLPMCEKYDHEIKTEKLLPLTRSDEFLEAITSSVGLVERFDNPGLTLYYTLTHKQFPITPWWSLSKRVLYVTVFDYKERTTRIFTRGPEGNHFYSTGSEVPVIDLEHHSITVNFGEPLDPANDPVTSRSFIQSISDHHHSIMTSIFSATTDPNRKRVFSVFNNWTMRIADTETGSASGGDEKQDRLDNKSIINNISFKLSDFPELEVLVKKRLTLIETRGRWIIAYMEFARKIMTKIALEMPTRMTAMQSQTWGIETISKSRGDVDDQTMVERLLIEEQFLMEILLVYEVAMWEVQLFDRMQRSLGSEARLMKTTWTLDCQTRLEAEIRSAEDRMNAASRHYTARDNQFEVPRRWRDAYDQIRRAWKLVWEQSEDISDFSHFPNDFNRLIRNFWKGIDDVKHRIDDMILDAAQREQCHRRWKGTEKRLKREVDDVQWRLDRGLEHCDQFWSDRQLVECRHSPSKWLTLTRYSLKAPFEVYSNELKKRCDLICIFFWYFTQDDVNWVVDALRDLRSVTLIGFLGGKTLFLRSIEDNHHILSINRGFVSTREVEAVLERNRSSLQRTHNTFVFTKGSSVVNNSELSLSRGSSITISFFGPTSHTLTLRLVHRSLQPNSSLRIQGSSILELTVPTTYTMDDITLDPSHSDQLSFEPGTRNQLTLTPIYQYFLRDIQLLDNNGNQ